MLLPVVLEERRLEVLQLDAVKAPTLFRDVLLEVDVWLVVLVVLVALEVRVLEVLQLDSLDVVERLLALLELLLVREVLLDAEVWLTPVVELDVNVLEVLVRACVVEVVVTWNLQRSPHSVPLYPPWM